MLKLLVLLPLLAAPASPLEQAEADLPAKVRKLVRQLDDEQVQVRNKAEAQLIELGPPALQWLPDADNVSDEQRRRLTRVRQAIEKTAAREIAKASTVSLNGKMTLAAALSAIEKQTGNSFGDVRDQLEEKADTLVETDFDQTPFWPAVDQLLDRAGLTIYHYAGEDSFALRPRRESMLPRHDGADYAGAFRIAATHLSAEREPLQKGKGILKIGLEITWEPRLRPLALRQSLTDLRATDNEGRSLEIEGVAAELEAVPQRGFTAVQMSLPFHTPPRSAVAVSSLRGTLIALTPGQAEAFEFDKLDEATKRDFKERVQKKGAASIVLERVTENDGLWEVWMRIRFADSSNTLPSHRLSWLHDNDVYLLGLDGKTIAHAGYEGTGSGDDENDIGFSYKFEAPEGKLAEYKFVYKTPASIRAIPIEFEIKDLELP